MPDVPEAYVHRIGRTARAGAAGRAISLCDNSERGSLRQIEKLTRQTMPSTDRRGAPITHRAEPARPAVERKPAAVVHRGRPGPARPAASPARDDRRRNFSRRTP